MVAQQILSEATQRLVARFAPARIILFGSQARGTADDRSDVDLLVVCAVPGRKRDLMVAMDRTLCGLGIARDVIVLTPEEFERDCHITGTIARPALLEGKVLYDSTVEGGHRTGTGQKRRLEPQAEGLLESSRWQA